MPYPQIHEYFLKRSFFFALWPFVHTQTQCFGFAREPNEPLAAVSQLVIAFFWFQIRHMALGLGLHRRLLVGLALDNASVVSGFFCILSLMEMTFQTVLCGQEFLLECRKGKTPF